MTDAARLHETLTDLVKDIRDPLRQLGVSAAAAQDLDEYLARLCRHVAPSYLPFATESAGMFCVHLLPGREALDSPVVHVDNDAQEAQFVASSFRRLPAALWLWRSAYVEEPSLREATDRLAAAIPGAHAVPAELWTYLDAKPGRWSAKDRRAAEAWRVADVGHPLAGIPVPLFSTSLGEAQSQLETIPAENRREPEVLAMFVAMHAKAGKERSAADVLTVLSAEAWRELRCVGDGIWRVRGNGMCEWDATLKSVEDPRATLGGTPLEPLAGHPDTYSGSDEAGPARLMTVADRFRDAGDRENELRQVRNAATLSLLVAGGYPSKYAGRIAAIADTIAAGSPAAAVARESARVRDQGP
jgi:hypothetical protein